MNNIVSITMVGTEHLNLIEEKATAAQRVASNALSLAMTCADDVEKLAQQHDERVQSSERYKEKTDSRLSQIEAQLSKVTGEYSLSRDENKVYVIAQRPDKVVVTNFDNPKQAQNHMMQMRQFGFSVLMVPKLKTIRWS